MNKKHLKKIPVLISMIYLISCQQKVETKTVSGHLIMAGTRMPIANNELVVKSSYTANDTNYIQQKLVKTDSSGFFNFNVVGDKLIIYSVKADTTIGEYVFFLKEKHSTITLEAIENLEH